jgi:hypothetical protein
MARHSYLILQYLTYVDQLSHKRLPQVICGFTAVEGGRRSRISIVFLNDSAAQQNISDIRQTFDCGFVLP